MTVGKAGVYDCIHVYSTGGVSHTAEVLRTEEAIPQVPAWDLSIASLQEVAYTHYVAL